MKKIFKSMAILAATAAVGTGVGLATGCSAGYNGEYVGQYSYTNKYGATYGMVVKVTVENNIITKIVDITNTEDALATQAGYEKDWSQGGISVYKESNVHWEIVSPGWKDYFNANKGWLLNDGKLLDGTDYVEGTLPEPGNTNVYSYGWSNDAAANWTDHEAWLLQQYEGKAVADVLAINVYTAYGYTTADKGTTWTADNSISGEPYVKDWNSDLNASGLLVGGSTQGSGRLLLAVQNALSK
ncbi:MAG: hypothetical protein K2K80_07490 [Clostridia bacterium]|nr:hypothetical protein [Clostridia bacterium]